MKMNQTAPNQNEVHDEADEGGHESAGLKIRTGLKAGLSVSTSVASTSQLSSTVTGGYTAPILTTGPIIANPIDTTIVPAGPSRQHGVKLRVKL